MNGPVKHPLVVLALAGFFLASAGSLRAAEKMDLKSLTNTLGMKLLLIPKGEFTMGSEELPSEKPTHKVRITKPFYLASHIVTVGQFKAFVKDTGYKTEAETNDKGALGFDAEAKWIKPEDKLIVTLSIEGTPKKVVWIDFNPKKYGHEAD